MRLYESEASFNVLNPCVQVVAVNVPSVIERGVGMVQTGG